MMDTETKPKSVWKRWILVILTVLLVSAVAYLIWLFNQPAVGVVHVVKQEPTQAEKEALLPPIRFEGKYVVFSYPSGYAKREVEPDTVSLEKGTFVASGSSSRMLAFSVMDMRGKTLDDIPAFRLRSDVKRDVYEQGKKKVKDGSSTIIFTKKEEGYEKTAFILHGGLLLTLSVSSQAFADPERIEKDFQQILESVVFEK
jgi:hypothetical protein